MRVGMKSAGVLSNHVADMEPFVSFCLNVVGVRL